MIKRNNPGNVRYYGDQWQGLIPLNYSTGQFCEFYTLYAGLRAMVIDIVGDIEDGADTIRELISEFAPTNENNTAGYINTISSMTSIHPDTSLYHWDNGIINVIYCMVKVESGEFVSMNLLNKVYDDVAAGVYDPTGEAVQPIAKNSFVLPALAGILILASVK